MRSPQATQTPQKRICRASRVPTSRTAVGTYSVRRLMGPQPEAADGGPHRRSRSIADRALNSTASELDSVAARRSGRGRVGGIRYRRDIKQFRLENFPKGHLVGGPPFLMNAKRETRLRDVAALIDSRKSVAHARRADRSRNCSPLRPR